MLKLDEQQFLGEATCALSEVYHTYCHSCSHWTIRTPMIIFFRENSPHHMLKTRYLIWWKHIFCVPFLVSLFIFLPFHIPFCLYIFFLPLIFPTGLHPNQEVHYIYWKSEFQYIKPSIFLCRSVQIVTKSNRSLTSDLVHREESTRSTHPRNLGKLTVHAEESVSSKTTTEMILRCSDLEYKDLFSKSVWAAKFLILFLYS